MMGFEDGHPGMEAQPHAATPLPEEPAAAPKEAQPAVREPIWLLVLGITAFALLLFFSWYRDAMRQQLKALPLSQTARTSTYLVEYFRLQQLEGPSSVIGTASVSALSQTAVQAADAWDAAAEKTTDPDLRAKLAVNAAALRGTVNDLPGAQAALARAATQQPSRAVLFRALQPLYAQPSRPVTLSTADQQYLRDISAGSLMLSRNAELAGDKAAAISALRPGATAGKRLMILSAAIGVLIGAIFIAAFILAIILYPRVADSLKTVKEPEATPPSWGPGAALLTVSAIYLLSSALLGLTGIKMADTRLFLLLYAPVMIISTVVGLGIFLLLLGKKPWEWHVFGWRRTRHGVGYGLLALLISLPVIWLGAWISERIFHNQLEYNPLIPALQTVRDPWMILLLVFMAVVMAPIIEETLFRGLLFRAFNTRMPFWGAAIVSGVLFSLAHGQLVAVLPIALIGTLFAFLTRRTDSLWASAAAHAVFNSFSTVVVLLLVWAFSAA